MLTNQWGPKSSGLSDPRERTKNLFVFFIFFFDLHYFSFSSSSFLSSFFLLFSYSSRYEQERHTKAPHTTKKSKNPGAMMIKR